MNERSGTLNGCEKEALALNHFSMNKFEDCEDNNYCRVRREIAKMAKKARGIMEERGSGKTAPNYELEPVPRAWGLQRPLRLVQSRPPMDEQVFGQRSDERRVLYDV